MMRRFPFDRLHHSARRQSRRHIQQQMHMIGSHMPLHDLDIQRSANLSRQIPHLFPDLSSQSRLAVLGDEHKVISQPIHCMRTFPILRHLRSVPPSLLKASPKGEGVHPSQSGTLSRDRTLPRGDPHRTVERKLTVSRLNGRLTPCRSVSDRGRSPYLSETF